MVSFFATIYNKITSIVNVIRLKLFTLISIVNNHGRYVYYMYIYIITCIYNYIYSIYLIGNCMLIQRVYVWYRDLVVSLYSRGVHLAMV